MHYEDAKFRDHVAKKGWIRDVAELGVQGKLLPYCEIELKKNDVLYMRTENGGGYGDPLEREPGWWQRTSSTISRPAGGSGGLRSRDKRYRG